MNTADRQNYDSERVYFRSSRTFAEVDALRTYGIRLTEREPGLFLASCDRHDRFAMDQFIDRAKQ